MLFLLLFTLVDISVARKLSRLRFLRVDFFFFFRWILKLSRLVSSISFIIIICIDRSIEHRAAASFFFPVSHTHTHSCFRVEKNYPWTSPHFYRKCARVLRFVFSSLFISLSQSLTRARTRWASHLFRRCHHRSRLAGRCFLQRWKIPRKELRHVGDLLVPKKQKAARIARRRRRRRVQ